MTTCNSENLATVKLKIRANRTRARTEELIEVPTPRTREGQLNQLTELVCDRYPGAELRVFHEGAGSFTRDDLHIVAVYVGDPIASSDLSGAGSTDRVPEEAAPEQLRLTA